MSEAKAKLSKAEELKQQRNKQKEKINNGSVYRYLKKNEPKSFGAVFLAVQLNIAVPLIRQELNRLVDKGAVSVFNSPSQGNLNSGGLIYGVKIT